MLGQLGDHPNIANVLERWEDAKTAYMSSRYLSGGSLRDRIENSKGARKELPVESILRIATEIAQGFVGHPRPPHLVPRSPAVQRSVR